MIQKRKRTWTLGPPQRDPWSKYLREGASGIFAERIAVGDLDNDRFDRSRRLEWFDLNRVKRTLVTVAGCGALGNECVKDLVLSGFSNLRLIDMDRVQGSNLNRCIFFSKDDAKHAHLKVDAVKEGAKRLDPDIDVKTYAKKVEELDEWVIGDSQLVLGCLDNIAARIHVNALTKAKGVPYIDGATDGLMGKVQVVHGQGPCLECNMNRTHMRIMDLHRSCTGKEVTFFSPRLAGEITTTSIIAAIQVREAIKIVHGLGNKIQKGIFYYDGMRNESSVYELTKNPKCPNHNEIPDNPRTTMSNTGENRGTDPEGEVEKVG